MSYLKHKPGSIEELVQAEASKLNDSAYQDMFKKELDKAGKGIGGMSPKEKKDFFNKIDDKYKAKNEELSAAQKKLPPALQKAIAKKDGAKTEEDAYDKDDEKAKPKKEVKEGEMPKAALDALKKSQDKKEDLDAKELQTKKTDGYKSKNESWRQAWEEATMHKMPDGTMMKGAKHKEETKDEANDVDNGDEKKPVANKDAKKLADSGSKLTKVETEPEADFRN
tara:strand:+ start:49 stop:720 length:672 start_codon:yes stop_codon:yes gene_type:complete